MTEKELKQLSKMKKLINQGKCRFLIRKDRDYLQELLDIGISESDAWQEILSLSKVDYCPDYRPFYLKSGDDALVFKKIINGVKVYIKLKIEEYNNNETTLCISFHIDYK